PVLAREPGPGTERSGATANERGEPGRRDIARELDRLADLERDRGAQPAHGMLLVLRLRAAVLADRADAGDTVAEPDRALGLVAVLTAGARGAIPIDLALRDQRVVAGEQVLRAGSHRDSVRLRRRYRRGRGGGPRLEVDVDPRALA